ncbi:MAG: guanylate kinase [bacterium]|nr:guanylate kinase [bacterium]MBU1917135.1 guanylate kinase [bacterium]
MTVSQDKNKAPFIVVSGPSGSGKTTICRAVAKKLSLYYSISHTTRPKREKEIHGQDYFFTSQDIFKEMIQNKAFIEWAQVYENYYGTSKEIVDTKRAQGIGVIVDVDTQGALIIKKNMPDALLIFIKTPQASELRKRLLARGQDSKEEIEKRLQETKKELLMAKKYDHAVVNDDLNKAIETVMTIIKSYDNRKPITENRT